MTATSIYSTDGLFLGICAHISSEFEIIGSRISRLVDEEIRKRIESNLTSLANVASL